MKYPIGIQSFDQIIGDGYVYVDKTGLIYQLVKGGKIYFLSRPRRFGKSLLVSTLRNVIFRGGKNYLKGLPLTSWKPIGRNTPCSISTLMWETLPCQAIWKRE